MPVMCVIRGCDGIILNQSNLNRHMRNIHNLKSKHVSYDQSVWSYKCLEKYCNAYFQQNQGLVTHLEEEHNLKFDFVEVSVKKINEFHVWKSAIEKEYQCSYIFKSKSSSTNGEVTSYYNCNRSRTGGKARDKSKQYYRLMKSQGSCKMESSCTSQIKVINKDDKDILIRWQKIHYGHDIQLEHLRLQKEDRQNIASKLISGVTSARILATIRDDIQKHLKRIDLLTTKDIDNIKASFNVHIKDGKWHENDAVSVDLFVAECFSKDGADNPILFYKQQGVHSELLEEKDVCLIIMNKSQRMMLEKFGSNIVAIDGTHGLNGYDFELTTIMVIDEFKQGFPVSFMFSNRKDTLIYQVLFENIKSAIGTVFSQTFMSDLAEKFYNAWTAVMGPAPHHIFCSWHVDRAWQSNLNKIHNMEKRSDVYKVLKTLQQHTEEFDFQKSLDNALNLMLNDQDLKSFGNYFKTYYSENYDKWAYCFRKNCGINTNTHLESMHKVIKYFYLDRKSVRRLDKGLDVILKYVRDKSIERIIKLTKGKNTSHSRDIFERHNKALEMTLKLNYMVEDSGNHSSWNVFNEEGSVSVVQLLCDTKYCEIFCSSCNICVHMFSCTCSDYEKNNQTICKHIHFIKLNKFTGEQKSDYASKKVEENNSFLSTLDESENISNTDVKLKNIIDATFSKLNTVDLKRVDGDVIQQIHYHLNVINSLSVLPKYDSSLKATTDVHTGEKKQKRIISPQPRFSSTKKKRDHRKSTYQRPSNKEVSSIGKALVDRPDLFISTSASNDHMY